MLQKLQTLMVRAKAALAASRDQELVQAKLAAFTRQVPIMYGLVIVNTMALAITHYNTAPRLLTVYLPGGLDVVCAIRLVTWWRERQQTRTLPEAIHRLRVTIIMAALLGIGFTSWGLSLFPYGDAYARGHIAFFMAITVIGCGFCLMHLRAAALLVMVLVVVPFAIFFGSTGNAVFISIAINFVMVVIAVAYMIIVNYRDFEKGIESRKALLAKQVELQVLSDLNFENSNVDSLTGLPNRRSFFSELERRMAIASSTGESLVVGILDLDGFKSINDIYGHRMGDRLLQEVSSRLRVQLDDTTFLARLGGDEFVVIAASSGSNQKIISAGEVVTELLHAPFEINERTVRVGCSIGFAIFPSAAKTPEDLFECADYALYFVKQHERGKAVIFSSEHEATIRDASEVDQALLNADLEKELWIAYQPITDTDTSRPVGFEALARWHSPTLGDVPPMRFITAAERSGSIGQLTLILLRKALDGAAAWPRHMRISFNLSAVDVASSLSILKIIGIVEQSQIDAARIDFEITETAVMRNRTQASEALNVLKALGSRISLDDFGTGYSSLSYIRELPLDKIKIDRSFIRNIETDETSRMILKTMVGLCSDLDLDCIVEGVETERQKQLLRREGCRLMQGYLFAKPMPGSDVLDYLADCERQITQSVRIPG
jgi:diguanylate cyclase (GGDEF)-like protein